MTLKVPDSAPIIPRSEQLKFLSARGMGKGLEGGPLGNYDVRKGASWPKRLGPILTSSLDGTALLKLGLGIPVPA